MKRTPGVERVVIALSPAEFGRLADLATQQDRDPYSQAQHLVRAALVDLATPADAAEHGLAGPDFACGEGKLP
ncbi:MAG TPA: hypothetical protein VIU62_10955 [Chloroflexota bacterium]|jgi:hypothetical protein